MIFILDFFYFVIKLLEKEREKIKKLIDADIMWAKREERGKKREKIANIFDYN